MGQVLNKLLGESTLPHTVYHKCPIHGKHFTGKRCPLCVDMKKWKRVKPDTNSRCSVCGKLIGECDNKGKGV